MWPRAVIHLEWLVGVTSKRCSITPLVVNETVDRLQNRLQVFGKAKILILFARSGMHFKNNENIRILLEVRE
jgi:hypothetical protein